MKTETKPETVETLIVEIDDKQYAFHIEFVQEIIRMIKITQAPNVSDFIEGVVNIRGEVIPVVDFRKRLNFPAKDYTLKTPIIFLLQNGHKFGLVVDKVAKVLDIPTVDIETQEKIGSLGRNIEAIAKVNGKIIFIVDTSSLFEFTDLKLALDQTVPIKEKKVELDEYETSKLNRIEEMLVARTRSISKPMDSASGSELLQLIGIRLGNENYALHSNEIIEVLTWTKLTTVPKAPKGVCGVVNLRGEILSVLSVAEILGIIPAKSIDDSQVMIIDIHGDKFALLVDEVTGLKTTEKKRMQALVATMERSMSEYLEGEVEVDGQIFAIIKIPALLDFVRR